MFSHYLYVYSKVLKEIPVGDLQPDESLDAVHESNLLRNLDHPSIVKFHDSFIDGEFFCIITEYCEVGVPTCARRICVMRHYHIEA